MINFIDVILHLDKYLLLVIQQYPSLSYLFLFVMIFFETGIIITPFIPGDSLLFVVSALAATGVLNIWIIFIVIFSAAVLGDAANYHIGKFLGPKIFRKEHSIFFHKEYLVRAQSFYEKYGKKTIILARFIPIIRTFAPCVAGIGRMRYRTFLLYNLIGAALWCIVFIFGGYFFGNIPFVKQNLNVILLLIIVISVLPLVREIFVHWRNKK